MTGRDAFHSPLTLGGPHTKCKAGPAFSSGWLPNPIRLCFTDTRIVCAYNACTRRKDEEEVYQNANGRKFWMILLSITFNLLSRKEAKFFKWWNCHMTGLWKMVKAQVKIMGISGLGGYARGLSSDSVLPNGLWTCRCPGSISVLL